MSMLDESWDSFFFNQPGLLDKIHLNNLTYTTATNLKKFGGREPRLMAKIDTLEERPKIFKDNCLSILPTKNKNYIIFKDIQQKSFYTFSKDESSLPLINHSPAINVNEFETYPGVNYINESQALDFALHSSIIRTFTHESDIFLTIRGRRYSSKFSVRLPDISELVAIEGVQIEIDGGYESRDGIYLFEAKIGRRANFNVRQLLFPYLDWSSRTRKPIIPIFFIYTNGLYYLYKFSIGDSLDSLRLVEGRCFTIDDYRYSFTDVERVILSNQYGFRVTNRFPFPQANDMDKVIDTVLLVNQGYSTKEEIASQFEFDERQGDYYGNAACFLGFLDHLYNRYVITNVGKHIISEKSRSTRAFFILSLLSRYHAFYEILQKFVATNFNLNMMTPEYIASEISKFYPLSDVTSLRRASTIKNWLNWVKDSLNL